MIITPTVCIFADKEQKTTDGTREQKEKNIGRKALEASAGKDTGSLPGIDNPMGRGTQVDSGSGYAIDDPEEHPAH